MLVSAKRRRGSSSTIGINCQILSTGMVTPLLPIATATTSITAHAIHGKGVLDAAAAAAIGTTISRAIDE